MNVIPVDTVFRIVNKLETVCREEGVEFQLDSVISNRSLGFTSLTIGLSNPKGIKISESDWDKTH